MEKLLTQLKDADFIREMGDDDEMGSLFVNPIILMPKSDYVKLIIDARFLNSVTDLTNYSWPLEPVQMIMTRVNRKFFSVSDLSCAYHQVPLSPETQKLTSFNIGGRQYTYTRGFYGLCGLSNFFSRLMTIHIDVNSSNVGTGCILIQQFPEGKRIISFNSHIFDKAEQKRSTLHRELCGIVSALQTYEHYIIGSPFPI